MKLNTLSKVTRTLLAGAFLSSTALFGGCGGSDQEISLAPVDPDASGYVVMNFALSDIPFPHDALFSGSTDGTLNIPVDDPENYADPRVAMNAIDGFSTSAPITFKTSQALDIADSNTNGLSDIFETGVAVYKTSVVIDPESGARVIVSIDGQLIPGVDYFPVVSDAATSAQNIAILPLKPLEPKTTYLITVNNAVLDRDGDPLKKSIYYSALSGTESLQGTAYEDLQPLQQLTLAHLNALADAGKEIDSLVASWSFTTQSTGDVLEELLTVNNESLVVFDSGADTPFAKGDLLVGSLDVPYFGGEPSQANPIAPLNTFWNGVQGSLLTQYNPAPVARSTQTIPVLMSVPNEANTGLSKPADGWPIVIFQHSVTENRGNLLAIADSLAQAGFAAVAIDMPLHGVTDTESALYMEALERTFNVDYVTQNGEDVIAAAPDGVIDTSGRHFINLSHLVVTRDNLRQAVADLIQLRSALENYAGDAVDLDTANVSFVGHSLGAMVGGVYQSFEPADEAVYAMPGLQAPYLLGSSLSYSPEIQAGLAAQGVAPDSSEYQQFLLAAQTVVDSADPVNYVTDLSNSTLLFEVLGDKTIPNSVGTAPLAGTEPWIGLQDLASISTSVPDENNSINGVVRFTAGHHGSLLRANEEEGAEATEVENSVIATMQEAIASFLHSNGESVSIKDPGVVQ